MRIIGYVYQEVMFFGLNGSERQLDLTNVRWGSL